MSAQGETNEQHVYRVRCHSHGSTLEVGEGRGERAQNILSMIRTFTSEHLRCDLEFRVDSIQRLVLRNIDRDKERFVQHLQEILK